MRRSFFVTCTRRLLRLAGVPALFAIVVIEAAALSSHLPFGQGRGGSVLLAPCAYPVWLVGGIGAIYLLIRVLLRRFRTPRRALWAALALATITTTAVLAIDVGCGVALKREASEHPDLDVPSYAYLANESTRYGKDNTLTRLVQATERACAVYHIPYAGRSAAGYGFSPTEAPTEYRREGAFGRAQYTPNGLLAEGYVFSLDVALSILDTYHTAYQTLEDTLDAYNRAADTAYADVEEALAAIREEARLRALCAALDPENGGTWGEYAHPTGDGPLTEEQIHALLAALATDAGESALLDAYGPLLALTDGVYLADILVALGGEVGARLAERTAIADVRINLIPPRTLHLAGGGCGEGITVTLDETFDEAPLGALIAAETNADYPLSYWLAEVLREAYGQTSPTARPLFTYYVETAGDVDTQVAVYTFLQAAADYDFALYEGKVHGQAVCSVLIGDTLGDAREPASAGLSAGEVRALRWQLDHLTPVLSLLLARNALSYYGGVAVAASLGADLIGKRRRRARSAHPRKRKCAKRWASACAVCYVLVLLSAWGMRWGVMPAVDDLSYGVLDSAAIAASPTTFAQSIEQEEEKYVLFALLSGAIDPALGYDILTDTENDKFCDQTLQCLYMQAAAGTVDLQDEVQTRLYDLLWTYYVRPDPRYSVALSERTDSTRRAVCTALTAYLYPVWREYTQKGVHPAGDAPIDALFRTQYRLVVEHGYLPLAHSDALFLVLEDRPSFSALLHLMLDLSDEPIGAQDVYGEPVMAIERDIGEVIEALADFPDLLDELSALAGEDLALPHTHRALSAAAGGEVRVVLVAEGDRLALWLYPTAYRHGGVGFVQGTLIKNKYPLTIWGYSLPFIYFALLLAPYWAIGAGLTTLSAPRRPKRVLRPPDTRLRPPRGA